MRKANRLLLCIIAVVPVATACGSNDQSDALERQVAELQSQLEAMEESSASSTTSVEIATTTSTTRQTTTTVDLLNQEVVRDRFDDSLSELKRLTLEAIDRGPTGVAPYSVEECENQRAYGPPGDDWVLEWVCNDHELTFSVGTQWAFDIWQTGSIVSPYAASTEVPFSFVRHVIDEEDNILDGHSSSNESLWLVSWEYQDGEWRAVGLDSPDGHWLDVGSAVIFSALSPQEFYAWPND